MLLEDEAIVKTLLQRLEPRQEKRRAGSVEFLAGTGEHWYKGIDCERRRVLTQMGEGSILVHD